jgi:hypothetical protein
VARRSLKDKDKVYKLHFIASEIVHHDSLILKKCGRAQEVVEKEKRKNVIWHLFESDQNKGFK